MTSFLKKVKSLSEYLKVGESKIIQCIRSRKEECSYDEFVEKFDIKEDSLLEDELLLVSLHVTTNDDDCKSLIYNKFNISTTWLNGLLLVAIIRRTPSQKHNVFEMLSISTLICVPVIMIYIYLIFLV